MFLSRGQVHIVPPGTDGRLDRLSLAAGVGAVAHTPARTRASDAVQAAISAQTAGYPERARENLHKARCYVPRGVARLLVTEPALVGAAVEAVLSRDARSLQACGRMSHFPPGAGLVPTTVTFNRLQYAQLRALRLFAPKPFRLPPTTDSTYIAHDLGMKLVRPRQRTVDGGRTGLTIAAARVLCVDPPPDRQACGFEMLLADTYVGSAHVHSTTSEGAADRRKVGLQRPQRGARGACPNRVIHGNRAERSRWATDVRARCTTPSHSLITLSKRCAGSSTRRDWIGWATLPYARARSCVMTDGMAEFVNTHRKHGPQAGLDVGVANIRGSVLGHNATVSSRSKRDGRSAKPSCPKRRMNGAHVARWRAHPAASAGPRLHGGGGTRGLHQPLPRPLSFWPLANRRRVYDDPSGLVRVDVLVKRGGRECPRFGGFPPNFVRSEASSPI